MPLQLVIRFVCDDCALEFSLVGTCNVDHFPFVVQAPGVKQPPEGWSVDGTECKCPTHASRVKLANAPALIAALKTH